MEKSSIFFHKLVNMSSHITNSLQTSVNHPQLPIFVAFRRILNSLCSSAAPHVTCASRLRCVLAVVGRAVPDPFPAQRPDSSHSSSAVFFACSLLDSVAFTSFCIHKNHAFRCIFFLHWLMHPCLRPLRST